MMAVSLLRYIIIEFSVNTVFCVYNLYWSLFWPNYVLICYNSNVLQELY